MIVTSEHIYNNPRLYEMNDIIQEARREREQKYGGDYSEEVKIEFIVEFLDKIK